MSCSSEDETDISESDLEEYVDRCYEQLKDGGHNVKLSDEVYRCPYCPGKKKLVYQFKDLLRHASDISKGSQNRDIKHKGKHLGLAKYMKNDLNGEDDLSSELAGLNLDLSPGDGGNELFVCPWMGIVANADAESSSGLKNHLAEKGVYPIRIRLLPSGGFAVVEFKRDWSGFYRAIKFEKEFEANHHGKKDYLTDPDSADGLYGWVARDEDYNSNSALGKHLQKYGDLKTVDDLEAEEKRKTSLLIADLSNTIEELKMRIEELEHK